MINDDRYLGYEENWLNDVLVCTIQEHGIHLQNSTLTCEPELAIKPLVCVVEEGVVAWSVGGLKLVQKGVVHFASFCWNHPLVSTDPALGWQFDDSKKE